MALHLHHSLSKASPSLPALTCRRLQPNRLAIPCGHLVCQPRPHAVPQPRQAIPLPQAVLLALVPAILQLITI